MADCPHCQQDVQPEIVGCIGCDEYFVRFRKVGRPRLYHSVECKQENAGRHLKSA